MSLHLRRAAAVHGGRPRNRGAAGLAALALLSWSAPALRAQEAPAGVPAEVVERVLDFYNRDGTIRLSGESTLAAGSEMVGDVAVLGGPFTLGGRINGDLLVIDGALRFLPSAEVTGSVLVVGGTARGLAGAHIAGGVVVYPEPFRYRIENERMSYAGGRGDALSAGHQFAFGRASFVVAAHGGYNRVEGLPIGFGPRVELGHFNPTRLEALVIYRTAEATKVDGGRTGFAIHGEQYLGGENAARVGARLYSEVESIQDMGLTDRENSLATFILHRDYRDHYRRAGAAAYVRFARRDLPWDLTLEYRDERDRSLSPHGIWAIFDDRWRDQPIVGEGTLRSGAATLQYDTRNDAITPAAGWFVNLGIERGLGGSLQYPAPVADTLPFPFATANPDFTAGIVDVRRYVRLGPSSRMAVRAFAAGSVDGKPLPSQRQLALGGEGTLPGYGLFTFDCGARRGALQYASGQFYPYYGCDRAMLFQIEYQSALPLARKLGEWMGFRGDLGESIGWVAFFDTGRAWTDVNARFGRGGGQDDFAADAGLGLRIERIGVYWAYPLSGHGRGVNLFVRIAPRL